MDSEWDFEMTKEEYNYVAKLKLEHDKESFEKNEKSRIANEIRIADFHSIAPTLIEIDRVGYAVVDCLSKYEIDMAKTMFKDWVHTVPEGFCSTTQHPKLFKVNHQPFAWYIRTRPSVLDFFKKSEHSEDLCSSFAGPRYWPGKSGPLRWQHTGYHTDQKMFDQGRHGTCGYVALTDNVKSGFSVIPGSHRQHHTLVNHAALSTKPPKPSDWNNAHHPDFKKKNAVNIVLKAGQMFLYDARLSFAIKQSNEKIIGQYVGYFARENISAGEDAIRKQAFYNQLTSTNMPFPFQRIRTRSDRSQETLNYWGMFEEIKNLV